jgi:curli biogenesis system outer membrane secretion channel CsgG
MIGALTKEQDFDANNRVNTNKAVVVLDYRIVDIETSEVIATGEARGESKRSSTGFGAALLSGWTGAAGGSQVGRHS